MPQVTHAHEPLQPGTIRDELPDANDARQFAEAEDVVDTNFCGLQRPPMLFSRDGHGLFLGDMYRGHAAFLVCGGPSLGQIEPAWLEQRGVLTLAVNNAAAVVRPRLWCCVDDPGNFVDAIWRDPGITKFVPLAHLGKKIVVRDEHGELVESNELVGDMPAVLGFRRNEAFVAERWLYESSFNWGNHADRADGYGLKGGRSVMYVALRLLHHLGVRRVYLLGCDFRMTEQAPNYAFDQQRSKAAVRNNNATYEIFNARMRHLLPHFRTANFEVLNCTPNSGLTVFPYLPLSTALQQATSRIPVQIDTAGMYDRQARKRDAARQAAAASRDGIARQRPFPSLALVVPLRGQCIRSFPDTYAEWQKIKPWIGSLPMLVLHRSGACRCAAALKKLSKLPNLRVLPVPIEADSRHDWELIKVKTVPSLIDTEWFAILDPTAAAQSDGGGAFADGMANRDEDGVPVFFAPISADQRREESLQRLEEWGRNVGAFSVRRSLRGVSTADAPGDRFLPLSDTLFYGRTEWCRQVATFIGNSLPCESQAEYLQYCALRLGQPYVGTDLRKLGWALKT